MADRPSRRDLLKQTGALVLGGGLAGVALGQEGIARGTVVGQPEGAKAGAEVLAAGGNAVDAAVTAALTAAVVSVPNCGIGGYGGHMVIALPGGKKVTAIDYNSAAPAAARPDLFPVDQAGRVKDRVNSVGWLAVGVPGTLAGMQRALDRYGTIPLRRALEPAIRYAADGFEVSKGLATAFRSARALLEKDPGAKKLFLAGGEPPRAGERFKNPDLARMLEALAQANSVESFYRGPIARRIAAAFAEHGGLVTEADLAAYQAREVEPLELSWRGCSIRTAPLTAGGATVLEALHILKALRWDERPAGEPHTRQARVEALRIAWADRLRYFGDPTRVDVPLGRLLSEGYARQMAARVEAALRDGKPAPAGTDGRSAGGTIHLSAADRDGMLVSLTLTHGEGFGARVVVDGLGLVLGHGMSRFDPHPDHPNAPGPGKRPLHNMCPTVVLRDGRPVFAVGAAGGRRIPNALFEILAQYVGRGARAEDALAAPRLHTEGGMDVVLEPAVPQADAALLRKVGYQVTRGAGANARGAWFDPTSGTPRSAAR